MKPANHRIAGAEIGVIARDRLRGISHKTKRRRVRRAVLLGEAIWIRWRSGIRQWKLKHVRWLLEHHLRESTGNTRYQYWLVVRDLLRETGREHWISRLRGGWTRP